MVDFQAVMCDTRLSYAMPGGRHKTGAAPYILPVGIGATAVCLCRCLRTSRPNATPAACERQFWHAGRLKCSNEHGRQSGLWVTFRRIKYVATWRRERHHAERILPTSTRGAPADSC